HGQAVHGSARLAFHMMRSMTRQILATCENDPFLVNRLREEIGDWSASLTATIPELIPILGAPDSNYGPEGFGETRSLEATIAFLTAIGTPERPALLVFDDCQWADDTTLKLLELWQMTRTPSERRNVVIIAAFRS